MAAGMTVGAESTTKEGIEMAENDGDGGVEESVHAAARTALTIAMQLGEKLAKLREEMLREAERRDTAAARELAVRFDAERGAARAELEVVNRPEWWNNATVPEVARVAETAEAWRHLDDRAEAAAVVIGREVQERYGVDIASLVADERAKASKDRTEAAQLVAEADRLGRGAQAASIQDQQPGAAIAPELAGADARPIGLVDQLETAARSLDQDAERGVNVGPSPSDMRELAAELRAEEHGNAGPQTSAQSIASRADAGHAYDSSERREAFASSLEGKGTVEDARVRVRADVDQARPAHEAVTARSSSRARAGRSGGAGRTRDRGDRSR